MKRNPFALGLSAALAGCAPAPAEPEAPAAEQRALQTSVPPHWIGTFTMVGVDGAPAGRGQFQLRLGLEAPDHFRAQRGCYTQQGRLLPSGKAWIVQRRGEIQIDRQCLARAGPGGGSPEGLFQHRAIVLSPPGEGLWISEAGHRWTYLPNPAAPPVPPPPPPPAPTGPPGMAGGGLQTADPDAVEALYRHQIGDNASGGKLNVASLCLAAGPQIRQLADPQQSLLARFGAHRPPVRGYSSCRWKDEHWTDAATGGNAIVHYILRFDCPSPTRCTAGGGYLEGNMSASGNRYELELRNGRWQVTSDVTEWIS
jgi:hypothetical protein